MELFPYLVLWFLWHYKNCLITFSLFNRFIFKLLHSCGIVVYVWLKQHENGTSAIGVQKTLKLACIALQTDQSHYHWLFSGFSVVDRKNAIILISVFPNLKCRIFSCNGIFFRYDTDGFFGKTKMPSGDYKSVMMTGVSVCEGYANVMKEMCE